MTAPRPKQHLIAASKLYPGAWRKVDELRADRGKGLPDWPDWCFLPLAGAHAIVSQGGSMPMHLLPDVGRLGALIAWRVTQGIYRFDPALYAAVVDTPMDREIPCDMLYRLPEWCVYVETPDLQWQGDALHGFFAHLEHDIGTGRAELRLLLDSDSALTPLPLHLGAWPLAEAIERMQAEAIRQSVASSQSRLAAQLSGFDLASQAAGSIAPLISLLLYLCSAPEEIGTPEHRPANPQPKRTKQGWRLFAAEKAATWDVGVRIGAALRRAYQRSETSQQASDPQTGKASPRGHVRRAHWHGFWSGPRDPERAADRQFKLRWLPPIPVNLDDYDNLPATVHPVKD
jgi:hypothetical protein